METPVNHHFKMEKVSTGNPEDFNPTCYICVNCSVTGAPPPVVTWEYQYNSTFVPIITNQSNALSPYFVQDNGQVSIVLLLALLLSLLQKLCFNDLRNYHSIDNTNYQCTATNVGGSTYGKFNFRICKFCLHCIQTYNMFAQCYH